jgi:hypothetical protein
VRVCQISIVASSDEILSFDRVAELPLDGGCVALELQDFTVKLTLAPVTLPELPAVETVPQVTCDV